MAILRYEEVDHLGLRLAEPVNRAMPSTITAHVPRSDRFTVEIVRKSDHENVPIHPDFPAKIFRKAYRADPH